MKDYILETNNQDINLEDILKKQLGEIRKPLIIYIKDKYKGEHVKIRKNEIVKCFINYNNFYVLPENENKPVNLNEISEMDDVNIELPFDIRINLLKDDTNSIIKNVLLKIKENIKIILNYQEYDNININEIYSTNPKFIEYEDYFCNFGSKFKGSHLIFKICEKDKKSIWKENKLNPDIKDNIEFVDLINFQKKLKNQKIILEFIPDLQPIIKIQDNIIENKYIRTIKIQYNVNQLFFIEKKKEVPKMIPVPLL